MNVDAAGQIQDITVAIDLTHTYIGHLIVTLISPTGTAVDLQQRAGGSTDNLIKEYTTATTPALHALKGQSMQGSWKLRVSDHEAVDVGKLNRWALRIVRVA